MILKFSNYCYAISMSSVLDSLKEDLSGELALDVHARDYFSTDGGIFRIEPKLVVYPRNEKDVVATVKFSEKIAISNRSIPITARGKGTDQSGASLSEGISLVFPAHMKKIIRLTPQNVVVQPGMIYANLETVLKSHGRFLPPYPASVEFCTIGGSVSNNAAGEKTLKYGATRNYVTGLRVVLHNGDIIETRRLTKKELHKKKKLPTLEGELYSKLDELIEKNKEIIYKTKPGVSKNSAGYALWDIKRSDGSFDMSQLFVGAQGTLGIITEVMLRHVAFNPNTTLLVGYFDSIKQMQEAVVKISKLQPSAQELVDDNVINFVKENRPEVIKGLLPEKPPKVILLVEFDDEKLKLQKKKAQAAKAILTEHAYEQKVSTNKDEQDNLWRIRRQAAAVIWMQQGPKKALPIIEDAIVPIEKFEEFLSQAYKILEKYNVNVAVWGHAGNGHLHIQPFMDLSNIKDRHKIFTLTDEFYKMVLSLGGSISGEHNDGIMRGSYLRQMFGSEVYSLFREVKKMFDPKNIFNPRAKTGATKEYGVVHLRKEYSMKHLSDHLPGVSSFH